MELADDTQNARSESSKANDPLLPPNATDGQVFVVKQQFFLSDANKDYVFMYKINKHVTNKKLEEVKQGAIA
jgi:hypothetical protein